MGIKLLEAGMKSFLIIEKSCEIGGTWWDNRYPGCACDIPSHLYSFSFAPSTEWTRMYPGQQEIHDYLKRCVERYGLAPYLRLNTRFQEAIWDESEGAWNVTVGDGMQIRPRVVVSGMGALHVPRYPELPGLKRFSGRTFHSSAWDYKVDLDGKNVAVVGTGASAIQFVPQIASPHRPAPSFPAHAAVDRSALGLRHLREMEAAFSSRAADALGLSGNIFSGVRKFAFSVFSAMRPFARRSRPLHSVTWSED